MNAGKIEKFNPAKIARVVQAAGLDSTQAELLANKVTRWGKNSKQKLISSQKIRGKVLAELRKVNQYAAGLFEWYGKTKK